MYRNRDDRGPWRGADERDRWERDRSERDRSDRDQLERSHWEQDRNFDASRDYDRARDFGWRGTELDRGFSGRYDYDPYPRQRPDNRFDRPNYGDRPPHYGNPGPDRYRDDDRYRSSSGDPYLDRGYERDRDYSRDDRDRAGGRDYWNDYPWSRWRR